MRLFTMTKLSTLLSPVAVAALTVIGSMSAADAKEARPETSDRTPAKETATPLPQVDSVKGETSDRTPENSAAAVPETSDRTPSKSTPTPPPQAGKFRDDTSDRTPDDN